MTNKKASIPVKKVATKKKAVKSEYKGEWKVTGEYIHPIYPGNSIKISEINDCKPPAGETRISELEAENYALKTLLSKKELESMPTGQLKAALQMDADPSSLDIITNQFEEQVSRYYNSMNRLDQLAEKLKDSGQDQKGNGPVPTPPNDWIGKLNFSMDSLSCLNNRLELTISYLQKVI